MRNTLLVRLILRVYITILEYTAPHPELDHKVLVQLQAVMEIIMGLITFYTAITHPTAVRQQGRMELSTLPLTLEGEMS